MSNATQEFENIHAAFRPKILRYMIHMVGEYEAEDLVQEVFVRVDQALASFRGESQLSTWIYSIATNLALDRLRSPAFHQAVQSQSLEASRADGGAEKSLLHDLIPDQVPLLEDQVFRLAMNACIRDFIAQLPEAYRTVLVLSEFEGLSNQEIADILGVSLGTVKIRLHRARHRLKEQLVTRCETSWVWGNEFVPEIKPLKKDPPDFKI